MMARVNQLRVHEIFHSVQGEGTRVGVRCVFIRLTGCHLRCHYCDTEYAFYEGGWRTLDEILAEVGRYDCRVVEVTGGEPLLQPNVYPLLDRLLESYATVMLETSGAVSIARVDPRVVRIVDVKCPSSGEQERNDWSNVALLTPNDEVKFVIGSRADYEFARAVMREHGLQQRCTVLMSPAFAPTSTEHLGGTAETLAPVRLAEWILADRLDVRFGVQLHKVVWDPAQRGV